MKMENYSLEFLQSKNKSTQHRMEEVSNFRLKLSKKLIYEQKHKSHGREVELLISIQSFFETEFLAVEALPKMIVELDWRHSCSNCIPTSFSIYCCSKKLQ